MFRDVTIFKCNYKICLKVMKVDQELLKMGQRLQIVFQTKKDTCFLLRSKLHLPIIMAENGADHSHLLPSPVTISLERNDRFFFLN